MRAVAVTITGSLLELRLKGCKTIETVDVATLYHHAIKARVFKENADKRAAKKARKMK